MPATPADTETLRALLDRAHEQHLAQPQQVADALSARAPLLGGDADAAEAVDLAEHVMLAHLADADALRRFVARLAPAMAATAATAPGLQRVDWCLARLDGRSEPALPDALRCAGARCRTSC